MCLTAEHVYSDHRSLGLPLCGTSGGLGGWGVRHDFLAVWSAGMISSAINTLMALEESGPFLSHLFKFEFNVMTFGLCNAGATYVSKNDGHSSSRSAPLSCTGLDDIVIFSRTLDRSCTGLFRRHRNFQSNTRRTRPRR